MSSPERGPDGRYASNNLLRRAVKERSVYRVIRPAADTSVPDVANTLLRIIAGVPLDTASQERINELTKEIN